MASESRNSQVLARFVRYCKAHPDQRFWQALLNWSKMPFICISGNPPGDYISKVGDRPIDPYNREGRFHDEL